MELIKSKKINTSKTSSPKSIDDTPIESFQQDVLPEENVVLTNKYKREANYINITDSETKKKIREMVTVPNIDANLNYIIWYKKDNADEWGLTVKGFPTNKKIFGTQHLFKSTWFNTVTESSTCLEPANHCRNVSQPINGDNYEYLFALYSKYNKKLNNK
jgi:hypothetical protein